MSEASEKNYKAYLDQRVYLTDKHLGKTAVFVGGKRIAIADEYNKPLVMDQVRKNATGLILSVFIENDNVSCGY